MGDTLNTIPFQVVSSPFGWLNDVKSTIKSQSLLIRARTARTSFSGLHLAVYDPFLGLTQPPPLITFACSRLQLFDHLWLILVGMANLRYATSTLEIKTGFMHEICFNRCRIYPHFFSSRWMIVGNHPSSWPCVVWAYSISPKCLVTFPLFFSPVFNGLTQKNV